MTLVVRVVRVVRSWRAFRRRTTRCVVHDGLWLTIKSQIRRYPRRYSDDGNTQRRIMLAQREDRPDDADAATGDLGDPEQDLADLFL